MMSQKSVIIIICIFMVIAYTMLITTLVINVGSGSKFEKSATNTNTANTIVRRDASGAFSAGTITGHDIFLDGGHITSANGNIMSITDGDDITLTTINSIQLDALEINIMGDAIINNAGEKYLKIGSDTTTSYIKSYTPDFETVAPEPLQIISSVVTLTGILNVSTIQNLSEPVNNSDAVNKLYCDTKSPRKDYGTLLLDPISPTLQAGDMYYNSDMNNSMTYDMSRSKWLSVAVLTEGGGSSGRTVSGAYYRRFNGKQYTATSGVYVPKGTIVYMGFSTDNEVVHGVEILVNGVVIGTHTASTSSRSSSSIVDYDFDEGVMAIRQASTAANTDGMQVVLYYKLRI